jgi:membrane protease YdiL (CAAX protease family)
MNNFQGTFKQSGVFTKLILLLAVTLFITVLVSPVAFLATMNPTSISWLKFSQLILSIGMFVIPPFVLAYLCSNNTKNFLHLDQKINWTHILIVFVFMLVIIPFVNLLGELNHQLVLPKAFAGLETWMKTSEDQATILTEKFLNVHNLQGLFFNIFLISMIPALGEELFFRGAIQGVLQQKVNIKIAIWITAIIFSAIHMQFYGFLPRMLMGAFFGYLLMWNGNLWLPVVAHFTNNFIAVIFYYLKNNGYTMPDIDTIGTGNTLWIGCLSGILAIIGFFWIKKRILNHNKNIPTN